MLRGRPSNPDHSAYLFQCAHQSVIAGKVVSKIIELAKREDLSGTNSEACILCLTGIKPLQQMTTSQTIKGEPRMSGEIGPDRGYPRPVERIHKSPSGMHSLGMTLKRRISSMKDSHREVK
jgi:hypothetical protein